MMRTRKKMMIFLAVLMTAGGVVWYQRAASYDKMLIKPKENFCFMCHGNKQKVYMESGHGKFDITCDTCHDTHGSGIEMMLVSESRELCFMCHGDKQNHFESSGHGKADLTCTMCHNPHGTPSEEPKK